MSKKWRTLAFGGKTQKFDTEEECRAAAEVIAQETEDTVCIEQKFDDTGEWGMIDHVGTAKEWPDWQAPQDIVLGDWVRTQHHGHLGRVYKVHPGYPAGFGCPEKDGWLRGQSIPVIDYKYHRWVSILVHEGGAVVAPSDLVDRITDHPAKLDNRYTNQYFREGE